MNHEHRRECLVYVMSPPQLDDRRTTSISGSTTETEATHSVQCTPTTTPAVNNDGLEELINYQYRPSDFHLFGVHARSLVGVSEELYTDIVYTINGECMCDGSVYENDRPT